MSSSAQCGVQYSLHPESFKTSRRVDAPKAQVLFLGTPTAAYTPVWVGGGVHMLQGTSRNVCLWGKNTVLPHPDTQVVTGIFPSILYICNCKAEKHQQGALQEGSDHREGSGLSCSSLAGYWGAGGSRLGGPGAHEFGSAFENVFSTLARWVQGALSHFGDENA